LGWVIETRIISELTLSSSVQHGCGAKNDVKGSDAFGTIIAVCASAHISL